MPAATVNVCPTITEGPALGKSLGQGAYDASAATTTSVASEVLENPRPRGGQATKSLKSPTFAIASAGETVLTVEKN